MIECKKVLNGRLRNSARADLFRMDVEDAIRAVSSVRGDGGQYEIRVRWYSDEELEDKGGAADE